MSREKVTKVVGFIDSGMCACVCVCVCACVRACVRACVCVCTVAIRLHTMVVVLCERLHFVLCTNEDLSPLHNGEKTECGVERSHKMVWNIV